jgi:peptidoglycan/LPS O-acetylase OafA/YrhL
LILIWALSVGRDSVPGPLRTLSEWSYPIYLFHLFFLLPLRTHLAPPAGEFQPLAVVVPAAAGLGGAVSLVVVAKRVFGSASRWTVGA